MTVFSQCVAGEWRFACTSYMNQQFNFLFLSLLLLLWLQVLFLKSLQLVWSDRKLVVGDAGNKQQSPSRSALLRLCLQDWQRVYTAAQSHSCCAVQILPEDAAHSVAALGGLSPPACVPVKAVNMWFCIITDLQLLKLLFASCSVSQKQAYCSNNNASNTTLCRISFWSCCSLSGSP